MAFVLAPEPPLADWLAELDRQIERSEGFFVGRPVVIDLAAVALPKSELAALIGELQARDIRIMGIENADRAALSHDRDPGPLRSVRGVSRRRCDRGWFGGVRRRGDRRRLNPYLWGAARTRDGRLDRQRAGPHLLPTDRGRTGRHRRPLSHCRRH